MVRRFSTGGQWQQARRIADEGARFNLSPQRFAFNRTLNVPMTALRFLRRPNQHRSTFRVDRVEPSRVVLRFKEEATPRLIGSEDGAPELVPLYWATGPYRSASRNDAL